MMKKPKLLLVDDDNEFVTKTADRLEKRGFDVHFALSGHSAMGLLNDHVFDVAVLDVRMPEMDGFTLMGEIKALHPHTEVILLTGYASVKTGMMGKDHGAYDFLIKPASLDLLCARINAAYRKKTDHEELESETAFSRR